MGLFCTRLKTTPFAAATEKGVGKRDQFIVLLLLSSRKLKSPERTAPSMGRKKKSSATPKPLTIKLSVFSVSFSDIVKVAKHILLGIVKFLHFMGLDD